MNLAPLRGEEHPRTRKAAAGNDRLSKPGSGLLGKALITYSADPVSPIENVEVFPLDWKTRRARAAFRLADIIRLAVQRRHRGLSVDPGNFAFALASTLGSVPAGPYVIPRRQRFLRWFGLDFESLSRTIERADLGAFGDAELETIIQGVWRHQTAHGQKLMTAAALGRLLAMTSAEREEFRITQIEAVDEPRADRIARQRDAKRERDRKQKRLQRGRLPRHIYEGNSVSRQKPWIAAGIGRTTWYQQRRTSVSPCVPLSQECATHLFKDVGPKRTHTEPGPARSGGDDLGVGADVHSHGGKTGIVETKENDEPVPSRGAGPGRGARSEPWGDHHGRAA